MLLRYTHVFKYISYRYIHYPHYPLATVVKLNTKNISRHFNFDVLAPAIDPYEPVQCLDRL